MFADIGFVGLFSRIAAATVSVMRPTRAAAVLDTAIDRTAVEHTTRAEERIPPRAVGFPLPSHIYRDVGSRCERRQGKVER